MNRLLRIITIVLTVHLLPWGSFITASAQENGSPEPYIPLGELPDLVRSLPPPPAFDSPEFAVDLAHYALSKKLAADSVRMAQAQRDESRDYDSVMVNFQVVFGMPINKQQTPALWELLTRSLVTVNSMRPAIKDHYQRLRPYEYLRESTRTGEDDVLRGKGSYPSGHTMRGWLTALILSEINPSKATDIYKRGWDYGQSRLIAGAHWKSDVQIGYIVASIAYAMLNARPEFRLQMEKAKQEVHLTQ